MFLTTQGLNKWHLKQHFTRLYLVIYDLVTTGREKKSKFIIEFNICTYICVRLYRYRLLDGP